MNNSWNDIANGAVNDAVIIQKGYFRQNLTKQGL